MLRIICKQKWNKNSNNNKDSKWWTVGRLDTWGGTGAGAILVCVAASDFSGCNQERSTMISCVFRLCRAPWRYLACRCYFAPLRIEQTILIFEISLIIDTGGTVGTPSTSSIVLEGSGKHENWSNNNDRMSQHRFVFDFTNQYLRPDIPPFLFGPILQINGVRVGFAWVFADQ